MRRPFLVAAVVGVVAVAGYSALGLVAKQRAQDGVMQIPPRVPWLGTGMAVPQDPATKVEDLRTLPEARVVELTEPRPIHQLLAPRDSSVEIVERWTSDSASIADARTEISLLTRQSAAIIVGRVVGVSSQLAPEEDWIRSTFQVDVIEVIKNAGATKVAGGTTIPVFFSGGDTTLDGVRVRVRRSIDTLPAVGSTYLYFFYDIGGLRPDPERTFYLDGPTAKRLQSSNGGLDRGISPAELVSAAKAAAATEPVRQ